MEPEIVLRWLASVPPIVAPVAEFSLMPKGLLVNVLPWTVVPLLTPLIISPLPVPVRVPTTVIPLIATR
jgi:hypothetical protein